MSTVTLCGSIGTGPDDDDVSDATDGRRLDVEVNKAKGKGDVICLSCQRWN